MSGSDEDDAAEVEVEIKVVVEKKKSVGRKRLNKKWNECGCRHGHDVYACCSAEDYDMFALGAVLEAFWTWIFSFSFSTVENSFS